MQKVKYPRTKHIPQSKGKSNDDKVLEDLKEFIGQEVVITEKLDGENTTIYTTGEMHARSIDGKNHPSRNWIKGNVCPVVQIELGELQKTLRLCGENMFACHSIKYTNLKGYFYLFSAWDGDRCLSWSQTKGLASLLEIPTPNIFFEGVLTETALAAVINLVDSNKYTIEGFVIRKPKEFNIFDFDKNVAKYVRESHVQTDEHWMSKPIEQNELAPKPK